MKKLILSAVLFAGVSASAQYQKTSADAPIINDITIDAVDTIPNMDINGGTADSSAQMFVISDVDLDEEETTLFQNPADFTTASEFPTATVAFDFGAGPSFGVASNDKFEIIGTEFTNPLGGEPEAIHWDNPLTLLTFPYGYGDSYEDVGHFKTTFYIGQEFGGFQIDSGRIDLTIEVKSVVDAFGSLETLNGTFSDVIRERQEVTTTNVVEVCLEVLPGFPCQWQDASSFTGESNDPVTEIEYLYHGPESKFPYASLTYNENEDSLMSVTVTLDNIQPNSVTEIKKLGNMVYPNPANDVISVNADDTAVVSITDISGRTILTTNARKNISIAHLTTGTYILTIVENNTVYSGQLIKH
jgi:hypothetical protein